MISTIRTWMFNKSLKEHRNYNRASNFSGVNMCKTVCIVADGSNYHSRSETDKYKQKLESHNKSVDIIFYFDEKVETEVGYSRHSISWNGIPQNELIDHVLSKEYDLLIYLHPTMEDHLRYLAILCNAKFKIGPGFEEYAHLFDLMVDIKDFTDTKSLILNIDKQLRQLSI